MPSFYFGYGYSFGSGGTGSTNCWLSLTNFTGTTWGHLDTTHEDLSPDVASDGTYIYQSTFDTSDGSFIMSFGVAGNEQLDNCLLIIKEVNINHVELYWNSTTTQYEGVDQTLATELALSAGTQVCFRDIAIPDLLIDIDFSTLEVV